LKLENPTEPAKVGLCGRFEWVKEEELWIKLVARVDIKTPNGWILWIQTPWAWAYRVREDGEVVRLNYRSLSWCRKAIFEHIMRGEKLKLAETNRREDEIVAREVGKRISPALTLIATP